MQDMCGSFETDNGAVREVRLLLLVLSPLLREWQGKCGHVVDTTAT